MRNLVGYLKRTLLLSSLLFLFSINPTYAQQDGFLLFSNFTHTVSKKSVNTEVQLRIESSTPKVLSFYTASIPIKNLDIRCFSSSGEDLNCSNYKRGSTTDVLLNLKNAVVKENLPLNVLLKYSTTLDNDISYNIPSKILDVTTEKVTILYPKEKGEVSWSSDPLTSKNLDGNTYIVSIEKPVHSNIALSFSNKVQYKFSINRVFSNTTENQAQTFEIIVPQDTYTQSIVWETLSPLPSSSQIDEEGNYILKYNVPKGESVDCHIAGYLIKQEPYDDNSGIPLYLSKTSGYWSISDSTEIKRVINFLQEKKLGITEDFSNIDTLKKAEKELFYKYLYQYVVYRLDYDKNSKIGIDNLSRLGANALIKDSSKAQPIDYADFYIALLRSFSIPSRMVLGYVSNISGYTSDGFYHYWVEYFDSTTNKWITVDPFIEEYTSHSLFGADLQDHIVILKRGKSPLAPTLTFFTPNDFVVTLDNEAVVEKKTIATANLTFEKYDLTRRYTKTYVYVANTGNTAVSNLEFYKSNLKDIGKYIDAVNSNYSAIILPKQNSFIQLNIPTEKITTPSVYLSLKYGNNSGEAEETLIESEIKDGIPMYISMISKIISISLFASILIILYTVIIKKRKK